MLGRHQAGEVGRARGRADWVGGKALHELHAFVRHSVEIGCLNVRVAVAAERPRSMVVGEDEDDVRFLGWLSGADTRKQQKGEDQEAGGSMHLNRISA